MNGFDFTDLRLSELANNMKLTVLFRKGGQWHNLEIARIVNGLMTEASTLKAQPEYIILYGHYSKEKVLAAMLGGLAFTAKQVTGINNPELPFRPGFM